MDAPTKTLVLVPWEGKTLKHYRIDGLIGQGGMGMVYRAHDLKLQRPVAIKVLPTELTADADRRKRFLLEARTAARVSHPAIAQVYDVDEHAGYRIPLRIVELQPNRDPSRHHINCCAFEDLPHPGPGLRVNVINSSAVPFVPFTL